jgi:Domain of unknown function (DUF5655)
LFIVKPKADKKLWKCPKCGRQFERQGQSHSCKPYDLELHFKDKPKGKLLYETLKRAIKKRAGTLKIESLECCIHFVSTYTFAAVKIFKDKIQVDFALSRKLKSKRFDRFLQLSANRYLYYFNINTEDEIDEQLLEWIQEANDKKRDPAKAV